MAGNRLEQANGAEWPCADKGPDYALSFHKKQYFFYVYWVIARIASFLITPIT